MCAALRLGIVTVCLSSLFALACGGDGDSPPILSGTAGTKSQGRDPQDAGWDAVIFGPDANLFDAAIPTGGPIVEITAPAAAQDPQADEIITTASAIVRCKVTMSDMPGAGDVNRSAVSIRLDNPHMPDKPFAPPVTALVNDEYEATFDLTTLPNGPLRFRCSGRDLNSPPRATEATLTTYLDRGPKAEIVAPADKSTHAAATPVVIQFRADPSPLTNDDAEADVETITLEVAGFEFDFTESSSTPGLYQRTIDFRQPPFDVQPETAEIVVTATNKRTPSAATRVVRQSIEIDGVGPSIKVVGLKNLQMVRGEVALTLTITDKAGIEPGTVIATIVGVSKTVVLNEWEMVGGNYRQRFDTRSFPNTTTQLTINIDATYKVGNLGRASLQLRLDNVPPILSLDPPMIREKRVASNLEYCSQPFDPVGDSAANDLQVVPNSSTYRVLVEDLGNESPGALATYIAMVDRSSVALFAQANTTIPLLIDKDGDTICDEINSVDLPQAMRPIQVQLSPVNPSGNAWYHTMPEFDDPLHIAPESCRRIIGNASATPPNKLCAFTEMYRVPKGRVVTSSPEPAVYAMGVSSPNECTGTSWELLVLGEGWKCLAARAQDTIGNVGVSPPLRVCVDDGIDDGVNNRTPDCSPASAPSCLGNCTPPVTFGSHEMF